MPNERGDRRRGAARRDRILFREKGYTHLISRRAQLELRPTHSSIGTAGNGAGYTTRRSCKYLEIVL